MELFYYWDNSIDCFCSNTFFIHKNIKMSTQRNLRLEAKSLLYWPYMLSMIFTMSILFCLFMIYPLLQEEWVSPIYGVIHNSQNLLAILLLFYGLFSFLGNQLGGFFADKRTFPTIYYVLLGVILDIIGLILSCIYKNPSAILVFTLLLPIIIYMLLPNIYTISLSLARHRSKIQTVDFESSILTFFLGAGALVGTLSNGPMTTTLGVYNPSNFINVVYVVLGVLSIYLIMLFVIHWYMNSAKLIIRQGKLFDLLFARLPLLIDSYSSEELALFHLKNNRNQKIIDKRKR